MRNNIEGKTLEDLKLHDIENIKVFLTEIDRGNMHPDELEKYLKKLTVNQLESVYETLKKIILSLNLQEKNIYIKSYLLNEELLKADWGSSLEKEFYVFSILFLLQELSILLLGKYVEIIGKFCGIAHFKTELARILNNKK